MFTQNADKIDELLSKEVLQDKIKKQASKMGILLSDKIMTEAVEKTKEYYYSYWRYFKSWFHTNWVQDYLDLCINWTLQSIKIENACSKRLFQSYYGSGPVKSLKDAKHYEDCKKERLLSDYEYNKIRNCIKKLSNYCDEEGLKSVLEAANINVITSYQMLDFYKRSDNTYKGRKYLIKRLELMTLYIEKVAKEKDTDGKMFSEKYWIRSTESDPHLDCQHALFLVRKLSCDEYENDFKKVDEIVKVYKPHDLGADNAVVGNNGMLAKLNELLKEAFRSELKKIGIDVNENDSIFATMDIDVSHHIEEFVVKKDTRTSEEAKKYFFRAGILKVITDAMAVIDLHANNIMPTLQGPLIIDAEIDFFHYGEDSNLINGNAPALSTDKVGDNRAIASFDIIEPDLQNITITSGEAFKTNKFGCRDEYIQGYKFMVQQLKDFSGNVVKIFCDQLNLLSESSKIRILPLATQEFAEYLNNVVNKGEQELNVVQAIINRIQEILTKSDVKFLDNQKVRIDLFGNELRRAILITLENGTIPAMYADMSGNLYLDNVIVGNIVSKVNEGVLKKDIRINKQQMVEIMKNCFLKIIDEKFGEES